MAGEVAPALGDPTCGAGQGVFGDTRIEEARPATKSSTFPNRYVTLVSLFATLGAFLFGLDIGYISGVENMQGFVDDVHNGTPIDPESLGFVTSIFSIGAAIAAFPFVSAPVLKAIGRKWSIFTGAIIFIVGIVIQATANGLPQMFAGRFFSGLAVGFLAVTVPLYIGEIAPKQFRGALSTFYQIAICLGIVVAFWVNVALQYTFLGWRISVWVQLVPCVTLAVGMVFLPYSPRWLLERQRWSEAREVFFAVRRRPANSKCCSGKQSLKSSETSQNGAPNVEAAREFETMLATYRRDSSGFDTESSGVAGDAGDIASALTPQTGERVQQNPDASVVHDFQNTDVVADVRSTRFCSSYNLALLSIGCTLQLLQQLCGMNAFMYYGPQIFEEIGISPFLFTAVVGLVNFGATLPAVCTQDRWGRIALLKASFGGMAACCFLLALVGISILEGDNSTQANVTGQGFATTMTAEDRAHPGAAQITAALSIFAFVAFFAFGAGPVVWTYCSEMFPSETRARNCGITTCANWLGNLLIAQLTPAMLVELGFSSFFVFGGFCVVAVAVVWVLPETKGVLLEEIPGKFAKMFMRTRCCHCSVLRRRVFRDTNSVKAVAHDLDISLDSSSSEDDGLDLTAH